MNPVTYTWWIYFTSPPTPGDSNSSVAVVSMYTKGAHVLIMSRSQFQSNIFILTHAWLNLWDERMTTGRINQVAIISLSLERVRRVHDLQVVRRSICLSLTIVSYITICKSHQTPVSKWNRTTVVLHLPFRYYPREYAVDEIGPSCNVSRILSAASSP